MHATTGHYATKVSAVVIPGNNPMDEANTPAVIGTPDSISYSIGKNGWITLDMQEPVFNIQGDDFTIYEGDPISEGYTCMVAQTIDGPWISLGSATGTKSFDLATTGLASIRFIKITDDGDGLQKVSDAGFDLDAIEAIEQITGTVKTEKGACLLKVFPNPASEMVTIRADQTVGKGTIKIYNTRGQAMIGKSTSGDLMQIDITSLAAGVYYVKFTNTSTTGVIKLIKNTDYEKP
jgi:hypothetical protein